MYAFKFDFTLGDMLYTGTAYAKTEAEVLFEIHVAIYNARHADIHIKRQERLTMVPDSYFGIRRIYGVRK